MYGYGRSSFQLGIKAPLGLSRKKPTLAMVIGFQ